LDTESAASLGQLTVLWWVGKTETEMVAVLGVKMEHEMVGSLASEVVALLA